MDTDTIELVARYAISKGYTRKVSLANRKLGYSELAMAAGQAGKPADYALVKPDSDDYAFVRTTDGHWVNGTFGFNDTWVCVA